MGGFLIGLAWQQLICEMVLVVVGFLWASRPIGEEFLMDFHGS